MLFSLIVTVLVLSFLLPVSGYFGYLYGRSLGEETGKVRMQDKIPKWPKAKPKIPEDVMRFNDIIENINNYQGSAQGQKEVRK